MPPVVPPAPGQPVPANAATTYQQHYRTSNDPLQGDYGAWMAAHSTDVANTPAAVRDTMLSTSDEVAKVYVYLSVPLGGGTPVVQTVYRPRQYSGLPGQPTPWDGQIFAFATDLQPGNQITSVMFPADAFHLAPQVYAPDLASVVQFLTAAPDVVLLGPFAAGDANTIVTRSRFFAPVPHEYVPLLLGATLTPREAFVRLFTPATADNRLAALEPLLDWLRCAIVASPHAVLGQQPTSPVMHDAVVAPVPDVALTRHRWGLVISDMPHLAGATRTQEQAVMHAVAAMQQAQVATATQALMERNEARAPKLPSNKFPATINGLMLTTGAVTETHLPPIWHALSNSTKPESRGVLASALRDRSLHGAAATSLAPLATKEMLECFQGQRLFSDDSDNLEEGLQLYRFAPEPPAAAAATRTRTDMYDLVQCGTGAPSISDLNFLAASKIHVPTDHFSLTTAMKQHSVAMDVYLGGDHPFCAFYRTWIVRTWDALEHDLRRYIGEVYFGNAAMAYTRFGRWISLRLNEYLGRLSAEGTTTALPALGNFKTLITMRDNTFPMLPAKYLAPTRPGPHDPRPALPELPAAVPALPVAPAPPAPATRGSERVLNPRPSAEAANAFTALDLRVRQARALVAPVTGARGCGICPSYHGIGTCYTACGLAASHKLLSAEDVALFVAYCATVKAKA